MPFAKVGIVYAMEGKEEKEKKQSKLKIKKGKVLGKIAFNDITKAQELLAKKNYDGALKILNNMLKDDRFNEFERGKCTYKCWNGLC